MTMSCESFDSEVIRSSAMPSAKYSCSASPLMLTNGRTATDGLAGGAWAGSDAGPVSAASQRQTSTGREMFFSLCSPSWLNPRSALPPT